MKRRLQGLVLAVSLLLCLVPVPTVHGAAKQDIYVIKSVRWTTEGKGLVKYDTILTDGHLYDYQYNGKGLVTQRGLRHFDYDVSAKKFKLLPGTRINAYHYDEANRLTLCEEVNWDTKYTWGYKYDDAGRLCGITTMGEAGESEGHLSTVEVDAQGRMVKERDITSSGNEYGRKYTYGKNSVFVRNYGTSNTDGTKYLLDSQGNVKKIMEYEFFGGKKNIYTTIDYDLTYDRNGCLKKMESEGQTFKFTYQKVSVDKNVIKKIKEQQWCIINLEDELMGSDFGGPAAFLARES